MKKQIMIGMCIILILASYASAQEQGPQYVADPDDPTTWFETSTWEDHEGKERRSYGGVTADGHQFSYGYQIRHGDQIVTYDNQGNPVMYQSGDTTRTEKDTDFDTSVQQFESVRPDWYQDKKDTSVKVGTAAYSGGYSQTRMVWDENSQSYQPRGNVYYDLNGKEIGGYDEQGLAYVMDKDGKRDTTTAFYLSDAIEKVNMQAIAGEKGWELDEDGEVDTSKMTPEEKAEYDKIQDAVETDAEAKANELERQGRSRAPCATNAWACMGSILKAYDQYKGIGETFAMFIPSYGEWVQSNREKITQSFCLATGITKCTQSLICGFLLDLDTGTILAGRGPGGEVLTSGTILAEKSPALDMTGLDRQLLIDIFGTNTTTIGNKFYNFSDPAFDPKTFRTKLRLYHFRYHIQNNVEGNRDLKYNVEFRGPGRAAKWYPQDRKLEPKQSEIKDKYKFSANEYDEVCLTFDPPLPSSNQVIVRPKFVNHLCRPISEYQGGAQLIEGREESGQHHGSAATEGGGI